MIRKPNDWESTQPLYGTAPMQVSPGGHVCVIQDAVLTKSRNTGRDMLELSLEIREGGRFDGIYAKQYDTKLRSARAGQRVVWPCRYFQMLNDYQQPELTHPRFRGLIKAVEESNTGFVWNWDERALKGRRIGFIFREEEYLGQNDGAVHVSVRPFACIPADRAAEADVPRRLELQPAQKMAAEGFSEVNDDNDELPF